MERGGSHCLNGTPPPHRHSTPSRTRPYASCSWHRHPASRLAWVHASLPLYSYDWNGYLVVLPSIVHSLLAHTPSSRSLRIDFLKARPRSPSSLIVAVSFHLPSSSYFSKLPLSHFQSFTYLTLLSHETDTLLNPFNLPLPSFKHKHTFTMSRFAPALRAAARRPITFGAAMTSSSRPFHTSLAARTPAPGNSPPVPGVLPEMSLRDKVIIVSGGARGLGLVQAEALMEAGATGKTTPNPKVRCTSSNRVTQSTSSTASPPPRTTPSQNSSPSPSAQSTS